MAGTHIGLITSVVASTSWGLSIGSAPATDVGGLDSFVSVTTSVQLSNSNPRTEEAWIEGALGAAVDYIQDGNNVAITATNDDASVFTWLLTAPESDYFLIKNARYWALYQNTANQAYAVVDSDFLPDAMNFGNATISHYGLVNPSDATCCTNPPSDVPVPAPLALIGLGLFGLGFSKKRRDIS